MSGATKTLLPLLDPSRWGPHNRHANVNRDIREGLDVLYFPGTESIWARRWPWRLVKDGSDVHAHVQKVVEKTE